MSTTTVKVTDQVTCTEMPGVEATVVRVVGTGPWARVTIEEPHGTARMLVPAFTVTVVESMPACEDCGAGVNETCRADCLALVTS